jgi:hypothetical protein
MARSKTAKRAVPKSTGPILHLVQEGADGERSERDVAWPARKVTLKQHLEGLGISCARQDLFLDGAPVKPAAKLGHRPPTGKGQGVLTLRERPAGS